MTPRDVALQPVPGPARHLQPEMSRPAGGDVQDTTTVLEASPDRQGWRRPTTTRARPLAARVLCIVAALVLWQAAVQSGLVSTAALAAPADVARALVSLLTTAQLWSSLGQTLTTWAIGLGVSICLALPVGLLLGSSNTLYRMFRLTIDFLRTIPPVALLPLALLLYGATRQMALLLVVFGSVWPLLLQSMYGVHQVDPVARDVARSYRLRRRELVLAVILPSAAPFIATGIRIAATISLLLTVGAEILGGAPGLGSSMALAQIHEDTPGVFALVVLAAILGTVLNLTMVRLEGRFLAWTPSHRARLPA